MSQDDMSSQFEQLPRITCTDAGKVIGIGAYGKVLEVYVHGTLCAAKEIHPILVDNVPVKDFEYRKRSFLAECECASRMRHPNLVQVMGIHYPTSQAKLPWLVMELMDTSLSTFLNKYPRSDQVSLHLKFSILVDVAQGLEFLHAHDIVHRDLSSNNVLLTKHLVAKISDLGVAKVIKQMGHHTQTPGTPHFMPPEALLGSVYDKSVDVFSLACVTLHVVSHEWPEPENQKTKDKTILTEVQRRQKYLQFCTLSSLSKDCEVDFDDLRKLVESCLHDEPEGRPEIPLVREELKRFFTFFEKFCSLGTANRVEIYNLAQVSMVRIDELCADLKKADQKLKATEAKMEAIIKEKDEQLQQKKICMEELIEKIYKIRVSESACVKELHNEPVCYSIKLFYTCMITIS